MSVHMRTPGELIASIPVLLGFVPLESIVVVGVGPAGRVSPVIRLDREDCLIAEVAHSVASAVVGHLARANATSVVLVSFRNRSESLRCGALETMRELIGACVEVVDAWVVANGRFRSPECPDRACCPDGGRPVPAAPGGMPPYRAGGASSHGSPSPHGARAPGDRRKRARAAYRRAWRARATAIIAADAESLDAHDAPPDAAPSSVGLPLARWRIERLDGWRAALAGMAAGTPPGDAETGKLAAALSDIVVRDAAVITMVPGRHEVANALCEDPATPGVREALSAMIAAEDAVRPLDEDVATLVALAEHVAFLCDEAVAPALTLAGLALWWSGDDSTAEHAIMRALAAHPGYRLAELVGCALNAHMPPGWIAAA